MGNAARRRRDKEASCKLYKLVLTRNDENVFEEIISIPNWKDLRLGLREWTVLHLAVWRGNSSLVQRLVAAGLSSDTTDYFGDTPGDLARELDDEEMMELLAPLAGADKVPVDKHTNSTIDADLRGQLRTSYGSMSNSMKVVTHSLKVGKDEPPDSTSKVRPECSAKTSVGNSQRSEASIHSTQSEGPTVIITDSAANYPVKGSSSSFNGL